ncbi:protein SERAC1 isoform X2 [Diabrotica virgifera virgifera]|uniref:Protein SERAC1 n=1 Tax=Diabrotica virgifera virgifera TaxID=50390 RepID=A0A6P7F6T5_DIAVI|nr:protein SERAC1 isoform X2 [Diabrotica virgifera virgifera]
MKHIILYRKFWKYISLVFVGASSGWAYYQVRQTKNILENTVDTTVLYLKNIHKEDDIQSTEFIDFKQNKLDTFKSTIRSTIDSLKFAYAKRLVQLANIGEKEYRIKALRQLVKFKKLDDWHFSQLANMADAKTAIGLARIGDADKRIFMEPPLRYHNYDRNMLINAMRDFLIGLYEKSQHPCLGYFLSEVFVYEHNNSHIVDNDSSALELSKFIQSESDILPKCLESLVHHCCIEKYAKHIIESNGLPLMMEIYHRYRNNPDIVMKLCRIISYLSFDKSVLDPLHKSGWIGILSSWMHHSDIRIAIPTARALANLDPDNDATFGRRLYLLHPVTRNTKEHELDVIFVHGLLGGVFYTWRQRLNKSFTANIIKNSRPLKKDSENEQINPAGDNSVTNKLFLPFDLFKDLKHQMKEHTRDKHCEIVCDDLPIKTNDCAMGPYSVYYDECDNKDGKGCKEYTHCWPRDWLPEDIGNLRIIGVNYDTSLSMWTPICPSSKAKFTLDERSFDLTQKLLETGVGRKPIVWVTHSMGGLIVKNMLWKSFESEVPAIRNICLNTKAVIFYSTPHNGSTLANLSQATALLLWPSVEVQELRENSPQLKKIHEKFLDIVKAVPMKIVTFVETKATVVTAMKFNFLLVKPDSGYPGVGEYFEIPQDHLGICKPLTKHSFLYQKVVHTLKEVMKQTEQKHSNPNVDNVYIKENKDDGISDMS